MKYIISSIILIVIIFAVLSFSRQTGQEIGLTISKNITILKGLEENLELAPARKMDLNFDDEIYIPNNWPTLNMSILITSLILTIFFVCFFRYGKKILSQNQ